MPDSNRDRKPVVEVRRLRVGLVDQLDELTPEQALAALNETFAPTRQK
jgi:hypothetical protein